MTSDDRTLLIRQLVAFREKMLEVLADIQVDLTAYELALKEKGVTQEQLEKLRQEARESRWVWVDRYAERIPRVDGTE